MAWGRSTVLNPHHQLFEFRGLVEHFLATPAFRKISMTAMSKPSALALNHVNASCSTAAEPTHQQVGRGSRGVSTAAGRPGLRHRLAAISALRSIAIRALSVFYRSFALLLRSPAAVATPRYSPQRLL